MNKAIQLTILVYLLACYSTFANNIYTNSLNCNVEVFPFVSDVGAGVEITGLYSDANTKIFTADFEVVWQCNPWSGTPCNTSETVINNDFFIPTGTYFLSVVTDNCNAWIPFAIPDLEYCVLSGAITNCTEDNSGVFNYELFVSGPVGSTYLVYLFDIGSGPYTRELTYNELHNITESGFSGEFKYVEDVNDPNCNIQITYSCSPLDSEVTIENCPADIIVGLPLDGGETVVSWTEPFCNSTCAGDGAICFTNQTSGPTNGASLSEGVYAVTYEATDGCNNTATCSFTIVVQGIGGGCNVNVTSTNGLIIITGLTGAENTKVFDGSFNVEFECNPWNGNPCTGLEEISGLTVGEAYYVSVQSDVCNEWIPITLEGGECSLLGTITNCSYNNGNNVNVFTYDIIVNATNSNSVTFTMPVNSFTGILLQEFAYGEIHTISETGLSLPVTKFITDSETTSCELILTGTCSPQGNGFSLECPDDIVLLIPQGSNTVNVSWDYPNCIFPIGCPPNSQICNPTQTSGPEYGDLLTNGEYTVSLSANSGCGGSDNCSFNISVQEGGDPCPINAVESSAGVIYISGLTSDANVKIFDEDYNVVWDCNPWSGTPCNFQEAWGGAGYLNTYFVSVVTDQCEEWFPITIQFGNNNNNRIDTEANSKTTNSFNIQKVFPNPADQETFVTIDSKVEGDVVMEIYNLVGGLQQQSTVNIEQGINTFELNISDLKAGIYQLFIRDQKGLTKSIRFVKIKD